MPMQKGSPPRDSPGDRAQRAFLRRNTKLIRHAAIRRILMGRYHTNGISSLQHLQEELEATAGITVHLMTLSSDLRELGAIKVRDAERTSIEWYVVPAWNPNVEELRVHMDAELVESEIAQKIALHVLDISPVQQFVYVLTEARAGPLVGYWISWLNWHGIVYVQEQADGCIVHCLDNQTAMEVATRLVGDVRLMSSEDEDDEASGDDEE